MIKYCAYSLTSYLEPCQSHKIKCNRKKRYTDYISDLIRVINNIYTEVLRNKVKELETFKQNVKVNHANKYYPVHIWHGLPWGVISPQGINIKEWPFARSGLLGKFNRFKLYFTKVSYITAPIKTTTYKKLIPLYNQIWWDCQYPPDDKHLSVWHYITGLFVVI